jgi:hypothetical protein
LIVSYTHFYCCISTISTNGGSYSLGFVQFLKNISIFYNYRTHFAR